MWICTKGKYTTSTPIGMMSFQMLCVYKNNSKKYYMAGSKWSKKLLFWKLHCRQHNFEATVLLADPGQILTKSKKKGQKKIIWIMFTFPIMTFSSTNEKK